MFKKKKIDHEKSIITLNKKVGTKFITCKKEDCVFYVELNLIPSGNAVLLNQYRMVCLTCKELIVERDNYTKE